MICFRDYDECQLTTSLHLRNACARATSGMIVECARLCRANVYHEDVFLVEVSSTLLNLSQDFSTPATSTTNLSAEECTRLNRARFHIIQHYRLDTARQPCVVSRNVQRLITLLLDYLHTCLLHDTPAATTTVESARKMPSDCKPPPLATDGRGAHSYTSTVRVLPLYSSTSSSNTTSATPHRLRNPPAQSPTRPPCPPLGRPRPPAIHTCCSYVFFRRTFEERCQRRSPGHSPRDVV